MAHVCGISTYDVKDNIQIRECEIQGPYSQDFFFPTIINDYSLSRQSWLSDLYEVFFFFSFLRASVV